MGDLSLQATSVRWQLDGTRRRWFGLARWAFFGSILAGATGCLVDLVGPSDVALSVVVFGGAALIAVLVTPLLLLVGLVAGMTGARGPATVSVRNRKVVIERGSLPESHSLRDFVSGWVLGAEARSDVASGGGVIELEAHDGNVLRIEVDELAQARAFLAATERDASHRTLRITLGSASFVTWLLYLVGPVVAGLPAVLAWTAAGRLGVHVGVVLFAVGWWVWGLSFLGLRALVRAFVMPGQLTIGSDGVTIAQSLRRVFVPFASLRDWTVNDDGVDLVRRDGSHVVARGRDLGRGGRAAAVAERLEEARETHLRAGDREGLRVALARGGRSLAAWRLRMTELLSQDGYREDGGLHEESLLRVLASSSEPAEARIGAALALRASDEEYPRRLMALAATCASEPLRRAFEGLATNQDDDALLAAALAEEESLSRRVEKAPLG